MGVDGYRNAVREVREERADTSPFLLNSRAGRTWSCRVSSDIQHIGAFVDQTARSLGKAFARYIASAIREAIGRAVKDPYDFGRHT
jgi:hypothetical protein